MTKKLRLRRPSPTAIVGIIALVIALSGTAVAGGVLTTKKFNNQSVKGPVQYVVTTTSVPPATVNPAKLLAACPAGTKPVGGGIKADAPANNVYEGDGYITQAGYAGTAYNLSAAARVFTAVAACVTVKTTVGTPPAS